MDFFLKGNYYVSMKSIIFDLDGTLWDPTDVIFRAWHKTINNFNFIKEPVTVEDLQGVFGMQDSLIGEKLFPYLDEKQRNEVITSCFNMENENIKLNGGLLYKNLESVLKELSGKYKLYIVSNCQSGYIEAFYHYHKLDKYFADFECSGNTGKPKVFNIRAIIQRNSIDSPVYVGDTTGDYEAAKGNEIPFIYAKYGFGDVPDSEVVIESIEDLLQLF